MADEKLSLSLDDIISKNKKPERQTRAAGPKGPRRGAANSNGDGPAGGLKARALGIAVGKATKRQGAAPRRNSGGAPRRQVEVVEQRERRQSDPRRPRIANLEVVRAALDGPGKWQHDKFEGASGPRNGARGRTAESGYKLVISNLDYKVSDDDIKELFQAFGSVKRASVNYDRSGRSEESAEVVFLKKADAEKAMQRYNNVALDGKPMHIELVAPSAAGRLVETLSSGLRLGNRLGRGGGRSGGGGGGGGGGDGDGITRGSGNMRSAQGGGGRRAQGRLGGRRGGGGEMMEE